MSGALINITAALGLMLLCATAAAGKNHEATRVFMEGNILDSPCSIGSDSASQSIRLGGSRKAFSIQLRDCDVEHHDARLPDWRQFIATFDGEAEDDVTVRDAQQGMALAVTDAKGRVAQADVPLAPDELINGNHTLHFRLQPSAHRLKGKGVVRSVLHFRLNYF
jgi:type 1 fimbria pilin